MGRVRDLLDGAVRRVGPVGWFVVAFFLMSCAYEAGRVLHLRPQPMHLWRQSDCLALAWNYYDTTWNLFAPAVHAQLADGHGSGRTAGELPVIYYLMGMLWRIIGPSEFAYRLFELLLHFVGSLALFGALRAFLRGTFWPAMISLLVYTSPVIVYYGIGFLPDVPALDLCFIAWWFAARHFRTCRRPAWAWAAFFFSLAAAIKVTAAMSLLALLGVLLVETVRGARLPRERRLFPHPWFAWWTTAVGFAGVLGWYAYAAAYNAEHGFKYTFNSVWPIWEGSHQELMDAWNTGRHVMVFQVFDTAVWVLCGVALWVLAWNARSVPRRMLLFLGLLIAGCVAYVLCWFQALNGHDYYFINPLVLPIALLAIYVWWLDRHHPDLLHARWSRWAVVALLVYHTAYAANNMRMRYDESSAMDRDQLLPLFHDREFDYWNSLGWWGMQDLRTIEPYLRSIGIRNSDRVIFCDDGAINSSLVLMGQRGWTQFGLPSLADSGVVADLVDHGGRYIMITQDKWLQEPSLKPYFQRPIGSYGNVRIFDLRGLAHGIFSGLGGPRANGGTLFPAQAHQARVSHRPTRRSASLAMFTGPTAGSAGEKVWGSEDPPAFDR